MSLISKVKDFLSPPVDCGPVDVTECEGPYVDAWEFPDPVMQADADLHNRIAMLEWELEVVNSELHEFRIKEIEIESRVASLRRSEEIWNKRHAELDESIDRTAGIRCATLKFQLEKTEHQLRLANKAKKYG